MTYTTNETLRRTLYLGPRLRRRALARRIALAAAMVAVGVVGLTGTADANPTHQERPACPEDSVVVRVVAEWDGDRQRHREGYAPTTLGGLYCVPIDNIPGFDNETGGGS